MFKKLAHHLELKQFDSIETKCLKSNDSICSTTIAKVDSTILSKKFNEKTLKQISTDLLIDQCFSQRVIDTIYEINNQNSYFTQNIMLLSTLKLNYEPIVLQVNLKNEY